MFEQFPLGALDLVNRFVFPPIKLAYGNPDGTVTDRQLVFYGQLAAGGPALVILEPVAVTPEGREHPKQLCIHHPYSAAELKKIVDVIHDQGRLACLHLNHGGAAANPQVTGVKPKAPGVVTCQRSGQESEPLTPEEIQAIVAGYGRAAQKARQAGFDLIEIQAGHGYLVSQFLNSKINQRDDAHGQDPLLFFKQVISSVEQGAPDLPWIVRISGDEMSPQFGVGRNNVEALLQYCQEAKAAAVHVGMGNSCFSPPWYFHHGSLPLNPQEEALSWVRAGTSLPIIATGRMGRRERVQNVLDNRLADLIGLGRPLIADPDLVEKWRQGQDEDVISCGYCLQGCLHRLKSGQPLGCNLNPEVGRPPLEPAASPMRVLIAGGGPAGLSAALYLSRRGHQVTLAEKHATDLGGQFALAWRAPGKEPMRQGLEDLARAVKKSGAEIVMNRAVDAALVDQIKPDLLVWATGAVQNVPEIEGLDQMYRLTSLEFFRDAKEVRGPRVLVIGAGRTGLEVAEMLGRQGHEVVATKRTDPIGGGMEMITRNLTLMRLGNMPRVTLMPHTTVKGFSPDAVSLEQNGVGMSGEPFQTVVLASGTIPAEGPDDQVRGLVPRLEIIGDAGQVQDIFSAVQAGYQLAQNC
jgi:2,4-dienoyl-CoA reductase-like NADH-dependent reductase (Old Yellow Enzyme family)/thioredoxin reductase